MSNYDVLTFGEALLRLTPPQLFRYHQTHLFEHYFGGSELNTAVGLAHLGISVNWITRLTNNPIGQLIEKEARIHGVHTGDIIWTNDDRIGLYYMEEARSPRRSQVIYDRKFSSASKIQSTDIPTSFLTHTFAKIFHVTGITLAISESSKDTATRLVQWAKAKKSMISFDVNYRSNLWDEDDARSNMTMLLDAADIIFIAQRDAKRLFDTENIANLQKQFRQATIIMTEGGAGCSAIDINGQIYHQPAYQTDIVCRVGGGDAFSSGYLYAYLQKFPIQQCLQYGTAVAAMKYSLKGDLPVIDLDQVKSLIAHSEHRDIDR